MEPDRTNTFVDVNSIVTNTFPYDCCDSGTTTSSVFLDIFGLQDFALTEPRDLHTEFSWLLDASGSHLDTRDTNSFLEPYVDPDAASLPFNDVLQLSSKDIDEPISYGEPIYETFWGLPYLPQTQDLEKIVNDARSDGTTPHNHFSSGNDRPSIAGFDDISPDVREPMSIHNRLSRWPLFYTPPNVVVHTQGRNYDHNSLDVDYLEVVLFSRVPSPNDQAAVLVYACTVCNERLGTYGKLATHARDFKHATLRCRVQSCSFMHISKNGTYREHLRIFHPEICICYQCNEIFISQADLQGHASTTEHTSFICNDIGCEKTFSRIDTYLRHQKMHQEDAQRFPCNFCPKYRGLNAFKRKDHLTQHLRGYHHHEDEEATKKLQPGLSCPYEGCSEYRQGLSNKFRNKDHAFTKRSDYTKHMKTVHGESEFPCPEPGCEKVGAKGYSRKGDLRAHLKKGHGITEAVNMDLDS